MAVINPHITRANGTILTASIYNADHVNHVNNCLALNAELSTVTGGILRGYEDVETHGAIGFELDELDETFSAVVDDTTAFMAAIEASIEAGHRVVRYSKCHAINLVLDDEIAKGLRLIGPGGMGWRQAVGGILTPFVLTEPAITLGTDVARMTGFVGSDLKFADLEFEDVDENVFIRGADIGLDFYGAVEFRIYSCQFDQFDTASLRLRGTDGGRGTCFGDFFGTRIHMGRDNQIGILVDQGLDVNGFATAVTFHGITLDDPGDFTGMVALRMVGHNTHINISGKWSQLVNTKIEMHEFTPGAGSGVLNFENAVIEGAGALVDVQLRGFGGTFPDAKLRSNIHDHIRGTLECTSSIIITPLINGYSGPDPPLPINGNVVPFVESFSGKAYQRFLEDSATVTWELGTERNAFLFLSQSATITPSGMLVGQEYNLFVRTDDEDITLTFGIATVPSAGPFPIPEGGWQRFRCKTVDDGTTVHLYVETSSGIVSAPNGINFLGGIFIGEDGGALNFNGASSYSFDASLGIDGSVFLTGGKAFNIQGTVDPGNSAGFGLTASDNMQVTNATGGGSTQFINLNNVGIMGFYTGAGPTLRQYFTGDGHTIFLPGATPMALANNGELEHNPTANDNLRTSYRGSDGVTRVKNAPLSATVSGSIHTIASGNLPAAATLTLTGIPNNFSCLILQVTGWSQATNTAALRVRASVNNGSSYDATQANYHGTVETNAAPPVATNLTTNARASFVDNATQTIAQTGSLTLYIFGYASSAGAKRFVAYSVANTTLIVNEGFYINASAIDALEISTSAAGNFDAGTYTLLGVH